MIHFAKARPSLVWQERQEEADRYLRSFAVIWETMAQVLQLEISDAAIVRATSSGSMGPIREDIPRDVWAPPHVSLIKAKSSKFSGGDKSFYGSILDILFEIFGDGFNGAASKVGLPFRFDLENPFALKWIEAASATLVREISDETMMAIRDLVLTAYRDRIPPQKAIDMVRDVIGLTQRQAATVTRFGQRLERNPANMIPGYDRMTPAEQRQQIDTRKKAYHTRKLRERAFTIARTETIRALDEGQRQSWKMAQEEGFLAPDAVRTWVSSPGSARTCKICRGLMGAKAGINEPFESDIVGEVMGAPAHPQCLPGDAAVLAKGITATSERRYDGDLIVIRTASGKKLSVTPNHPILGEDGWQAAALFQVGDNVISCASGDWPAFAVGGDAEHGPAPIHEVAEAFRRSSEVRAVPVPTTAEHFHGDGMDGEVAIIWTDGLLGDDAFDPAILKKTLKEPLPLGGMGAPLLLGLGGSDPHGEGDLGPSDSVVGGLCEAHSLMLRRLAHAKEHGLAPVSEGDPPFGEPAADDIAANPERIRETLHGLAGEVASNEIVGIDDQAASCALEEIGLLPVSQGNPSFRQPAADNIEADPEAFREAVHRVAGEVALDEIVNIDVQAFVGHVYNLETESGMYLAEGIVTHNCRCRTVVAFELDIPPVTGERLENLNEQARQFRVAAAKARRNRLKNLQYLRSRPNPQRQMRNIPGFEGARAT